MGWFGWNCYEFGGYLKYNPQLKFRIWPKLVNISIQLKIRLITLHCKYDQLILIWIKFNSLTKLNQNSIRINTLFDLEFLDLLKLHKYLSK